MNRLRADIAKQTGSGDERVEQLEAQLAEMREELAQTRRELALQYKTRQQLGARLGTVWRSAAWHWSKPVRAVLSILGVRKIRIEQLFPLANAERLPDGSWEGSGAPMFLVPIFPMRGWMRLRIRMNSSLPSRAALYFDTGHSFNPSESCDLGLVHKETRIDRFIFLERTTHLIRFDPIWQGDVVVSEFSLEPVASLRRLFSAVVKNITGSLSKKAARPSPWIGLKLLFTGQWSVFWRQLIANADPHAPPPVGREYQLWCRNRAITEERRQKMRQAMERWTDPPTISVIVPAYNTPEEYLRKCLDSVCMQIYPHWELCVVDDASPHPHVRRVLEEYAERDRRIKVQYRQSNGGIAAASNAALEMACGEYVALLDHDDELAEQALFAMAEKIVADPALDMIYSDEDKLTPAGERIDPFFKPDWSPEYFLSCMYTCHLGVYRTERVRRIGGFRGEFDAAQDYDLVLRLLSESPKISHVPDVLYHWRIHPGSTASGPNAKPRAHEQARRAIQEHIDLQGRRGIVENGPAAGFHSVRYEVMGHPLVSIIIPSACQPVKIEGENSWLALRCVRSIRQISRYENIEILVLDRQNMPGELEKELTALNARRVDYEFAFNWSAVNNHGAAAASGDYLLFLNDDTRVISRDWLERMLGFAQWPEIGAVGAKLLFDNGTLQHTGVVLPGGNPTHPFFGFAGNHPGYFYSNRVPRNWSAVTGACLMTRAEVFRSLGGFDARFPMNYNDVEYCLRLAERGLRVVYVPEAQLYHFESSTRQVTILPEELHALQKIWNGKFTCDPFYNPNLTRQAHDFQINPAAPMIGGE